MTECVKIKCDDCMYEGECADYGWDGCIHFIPKPSTEQTNEEWFGGLSTEDKAEWLCSKEYYCEFIDGCNYCPLFEADKHRCLDLSNKELWELWLKEKHDGNNMGRNP